MGVKICALPTIGEAGTKFYTTFLCARWYRTFFYREMVEGS